MKLLCDALLVCLLDALTEQQHAGTRRHSQAVRTKRSFLKIRDSRAALIDVVVTDDTVSGPEILGNLESGGNLWQWSAKEQDFSEQVKVQPAMRSQIVSNPFTYTHYHLIRTTHIRTR